MFLQPAEVVAEAAALPHVGRRGPQDVVSHERKLPESSVRAAAEKFRPFCVIGADVGRSRVWTDQWRPSRQRLAVPAAPTATPEPRPLPVPPLAYRTIRRRVGRSCRIQL